MLPKTIVVLGLSALAAAQTTISVSNKDGKLVFTPDSVNAKVGTSVEFQFWPRNHSVAESSFDSPCKPLAGSTTLFSGFHPVAANAEDRPTWTVQINNTNPIWLYCSQADHCQSGMVAVINPPSSGARTLASYKSAAASESSNQSPPAVRGGVVGTTGGSSAKSSSSASGSSSSGSSATSASSSPSTTPSTKSSAGSANTAGLSLVAAVALLVGGIACHA